ncbi:MAG TPA: hypothetical protein VE196_09430, partial [Pseudonocardiaceae bacterium]|nr:hypothetical protein [Pseudonocardiaceae bacterium]
MAQPDPLVQGGQRAEFHSPPQGGLPHQQAGEGAVGIKIMVGQHADRFQLGVIEQVRFVQDQHGGPATFGLFGGQQVRGLRDQGGVVGQ